MIILCLFYFIQNIIYIASQTWCLIRLLPLIIGDLVPKDDPHWINFLILLDIVDYTFSPKTTLGIFRLFSTID